MKYHAKIHSSMLLTGLALMPTITMAQTVSAVDVSAPADAVSVPAEGDIIVTARKRAERLVDVPIAITAFDSKALDRYATGTIEVLAKQVPQIQITRAGSGSGAQVTIRGIGSNASSDDSIEQSVAFNIDGVPTSRGRAIQQGLFDLANVQILKGPQALYFGKNSPAGVIVLESKGPGDSSEGYARAGYEINAAEYIGEAAFGGPITDTLGVRVAVRGSDMTKGYVRNVAQPISAANNPIAFDRANGLAVPGRDFKWGPNTKQLAGRVTVAWEPASNFDATLKHLESYSKDQGDSSQTTVIKCPAGAVFPVTNDLSAIAFGRPPGAIPDPNLNCSDNGRRVSTAGIPDAIRNGIPNGFSKDINLSKVRSHLTSLQMNYRMQNVTLTSVTGYYEFTADSSSGFDSGLGILFSGAVERSKSFSQEMRLATSFDSQFNFTLGGFYANEKRSYRVFSSLIRFIEPVTGNSATSSGLGAVKGDTWSAFAEANWKIFPELELSGGARYTHESKDGFVGADYLAPGVATALRIALPAGRRIDSAISENNISPQATLTWHPQANTTVYLGYRTGFKAGTISNPSLICACATRQSITLKAEKARGYEGGIKYESDDRRITGEFSIYHYLFNNLQVQVFDTQLSAVISKNAGSAQTDGAEFTANYRITDAFTVRGAGGYNRARYASFPNSSCYSGQTLALGCSANLQNLTGKPLPRAPNWAGSVGTTWEMPVNEMMAVSVAADTRYTSGYFLSAVNSPFAFQSGFVSIDGSIRLKEINDRWDIALIGRNLTNKRYFDFAADRPLTPAGSVRGSLAAPRTVLVQSSFTF